VFAVANEKPRVSVHLDPGKYTVEVEVPQVSKRDRVPVTIEVGK
jgi:HSP20 family molecular chaperone IbpA